MIAIYQSCAAQSPGKQMESIKKMVNIPLWNFLYQKKYTRSANKTTERCQSSSLSREMQQNV